MHLAPCVFVVGGREKKEEERFGKVWVVGWDIYAATRLGCLQIACSLSDQPSNQLGSGCVRNRVRCQGQSTCSSVVLKLQELVCAPENKVGSPEERAVIEGRVESPARPAILFIELALGSCRHRQSPSRPSLTRGRRH